MSLTGKERQKMTKKILIIETNTPKYDETDRATGLWLGETTHFYEEIISAGYEVDFASPQGVMFPWTLKVLNMRAPSIGNGIQTETLEKLPFPTQKK